MSADDAPSSYRFRLLVERCRPHQTRHLPASRSCYRGPVNTHGSGDVDRRIAILEPLERAKFLIFARLTASGSPPGTDVIGDLG